jgi:hypothetical protein
VGLDRLCVRRVGLDGVVGFLVSAESSRSSIRSFALSLVPWYAFSFALIFAVRAFGGPWPDAWFILACFLFGVGYGARRFL